MKAAEQPAEDPADEPNESAWNEEAVEGQLDEVEGEEAGTEEPDGDSGAEAPAAE